MGAVLAGLGSYLLTQQGQQASQAQKARGEINSAFLSTMVKQAVERANMLGENALDSPEIRKTFKSLGGDEKWIDALGAHAKARGMDPEVQARQAIFKGLMQGETPTEPGFVGPGEPRQATPEDVRGNISRLSDREAAFAFPAEAAARAAAAETALKGAQTQANLGRGEVDTATARQLVPAQAGSLTATEANTRAQTLAIPQDVQIRRDQVANQSRQIDAQLEQIRTNHADAIARLGVEQQNANTQTQIAEANKTYQDATIRLQGEQHQVQIAQIGAQVFDKVFSQGVPVGDALAIEQQVTDVLKGNKRDLDPRLARIGGISPRAIERTNQLSAALRMATENQAKDLADLQFQVRKGNLKPEEVILQLRQRNDPIIQVYRQQEIEKDSLVGLPIPDIRAHATQNLLGLDPKTGTIEKVSTIKKNHPGLEINQIPGIDPQFNPPSSPQAAAGSAPKSVQSAIVDDIFKNKPAASGAAPEVVGIPDVPPSEFLKGKSIARTVAAATREGKIEQTKAKASDAIKRFRDLNATLPGESRLNITQVADFITLTEGGMSDNQAFNMLLEQRRRR